MTPTEQPQMATKGSFVLFKTIKREGDHPRKPQYSGSVELPDGTKFELSGWVNEGKPGSKIEGQKYIKGEVKEPWVPQQKVEAPVVKSQESDHGTDDIPW
jgi:hypothetical protein